jgi:hypothetical protein
MKERFRQEREALGRTNSHPREINNLPAGGRTVVGDANRHFLH